MFLHENNSEKSINEISSDSSNSEDSSPHHDSDWSEVDSVVNNRHLEQINQTTLAQRHREVEKRIFGKEILSVYGKIGLVIWERSRKVGFDRK